MANDEKKSGEELLDEPLNSFVDINGAGMMETPFHQAIDLLAVTRDDELELMCRATHEIAQAAAIGYNLVFRFGSRYIKGRIEQIERLSVSIKGQGRSEVVQSLQAGSGVPDSFYEAQSGQNTGFAEE